MRRNSCLVVVLILVVLLLLEPAAAGRKGGRKSRRKQNRRDTCEPKYLELSPTHTRCLTDKDNARLVTLSNKTKEEILDMHNEIRAKETPTASDMMKLVWDDTLAVTAEKLALQCGGEHDNTIDRKEPDWPLVDIGQNIGTGHRNFKVMLNRFYSEKERFNYTYGGGYIVGSGHFMQLVSAKTSRVGCAAVRCQNTGFKVVRVCNYAPALDASRPPYQNGTHCGDCPDHCDASGKLCDCGAKLCYNGGDLDPSTCQCVCQQGWTGENCETLDCDNPDPVPACRDGIITEEQCGQPGSVVHDPNMCPHLCGLCPAICGGLECQNGGKLDWETCTCDCPDLLTGDTCEMCPTMDKSYCTTFKPREYCDTLNVGHCPIYCGKCNTTCEPCENLGDLNTEDCSCKCKGGFTGPRCEICPDEDNAYCRFTSAAQCTQIPYYWSFMQTSCPHLCGICTA